MFLKLFWTNESQSTYGIQLSMNIKGIKLSAETILIQIQTDHGTLEIK